MNPGYYGKAAPHGYQAHALPPSAPASKTNSSSVYSHHGYDAYAGFRNATQASFDYNRNLIPGLGLNLMPQVDAAPTSQSTAPAASSPFASGALQQPMRNPVDANIQNLTAGNDAPDADSVMEEGELSEGELEDVYEPAGNGVSAGGASPGSAQFLPGNHANGVAQGYGGPAHANAHGAMARERSRSYSPYLSPQEMHQSDQQQEPCDRLHGLSLPTPKELPKPSAAGSVTESSAAPHQVQSTHVKSIEEAEKEARETISRLWTLDVRYGDYVKEGIDPGLLQDLFKSLGFSVETSKDSTPHMPSITSSPEAPVEVEKPAQQIPSSASKAQAPHEPPSASQPPNVTESRVEERKDRIARLLAAKGSKAATPPVSKPTPEPSKPASGPPSPAPPVNALSKNTLLQQKMEALRKSREALMQKESQLISSMSNGRAASLDAPAATLEQPHTSTTNGSSRNASQPLDENHPTEDGADPQRALSIPGLFLSSTEPVANNRQKRPIASDLNDVSSGPPKRPFMRKRASEPVLIDVSDGDETDMDIDSSPRSTSPNRPVSPGVRSPPRRDVSDTLPLTRELSSSSSAPTPPTGPSRKNANRPNLESMNKKIEEMKRKIAEAEARKKVKQSRPGSLNPSQPDTPTLDMDDTANLSMPASGPPQPTSSSSHEVDALIELVSQELSESKTPDQLVSRPTSAKRSRSRATTERLSLIEGRRRQQLLKLQLLKSQIASIEKDVEESLQEEKRLREEESDDAKSDAKMDDQGTDPVAEEANPRKVAPQQQTEDSPTTQAMETDSESTNSSMMQPEAADQDEVMVSEPGPRSFQSEAQHIPISNAEPAHELGKAGGLTHEHSEDVPSDHDANPDHGPSSQLLQEQAGAESIVTAGEGSDPSTSSGQEMDQDESDNSDNSEESSEDYEPPEAAPAEAATGLLNGESLSHIDTTEETATATRERNAQESVSQLPDAQQEISGAEGPSPDSGREVTYDGESPASAASHSGFVPYETPLQYFRAYRFHPQYSQTVAGGLRSLTYSNRIDAHKPLCPDQLANQQCPRGSECEYQHFETMRVPDAQIISQLTGYGNYEAETSKFVDGLREVLKDLRTRKVNDLDAIGQGIVKYRAQFHGDESKILPLGDVSI
ncbi:hypothetical protein S40288_00766 [Stachybotrys chartarum IBT 40288]|nr:hypothetical protein S40288_00766 [Stachybotrys chartarum IBT 40288]